MGGHDGRRRADARGGDALVGWTESDGESALVKASGRAPGAAFELPAPSLDEPGASPRVGLDAAGDATAVWPGYDDGWVVKTGTRRAGGAWSAPSTVSPAVQASGLFLMGFAENASGQAVAGWETYANTHEWTFWAAASASTCARCSRARS